MVVTTPLGLGLFIESDGAAVIRSQFRRTRPTRASRDPLLKEAAQQVRAYFARRLAVFDVPLAFPGATPFERAVWNGVSQLRFGHFVSYADVARAIGQPRAHRGVAGAMAKTPSDLFVPAHRVIGADGRLKGCVHNSIRARLAAFEGFNKRKDSVAGEGRRREE